MAWHRQAPPQLLQLKLERLRAPNGLREVMGLVRLAPLALHEIRVAAAIGHAGDFSTLDFDNFAAMQDWQTVFI